jgi:hypothetical protein
VYRNKSTKKNNFNANYFFKTSKHLLIVESPFKISYIENILGKDYQVIATSGHICNIDGIKGINIKNNFEPKYDIISTKKRQVEYLGSIIKQYLDKGYKKKLCMYFINGTHFFTNNISKRCYCK